MTRSAIDWTFEGTWPHAPRWFETAEGQMCFVDVGPREGRPIVFVHGNPSWGYVFRNFIPPLVAAGYRIIVPDHLGFGRSDKPDSPDAYRIECHARRLEALLEALDLRDATIVPHDWGGPIGLYWATRHPERIHSLALLNTFVHRPLGPVVLPPPLRLFRIRGVGELFVKALHLIARAFLLGSGVRRHDRLTPLVRKAYLAPHPSYSTRTALLVFAREFPDGPRGPVADLQDRIHKGLAALASCPVLIAWGGKDTILTRATLDRWKQDFPRAEVLELPEAGHFLQEDAPEQIVPALLDFLRRSRDGLRAPASSRGSTASR